AARSARRQRRILGRPRPAILRGVRRSASRADVAGPLQGEVDPVTPKLPHSVLVVVHTQALDVLILERAGRRDYWQSVTGSLDRLDEPLLTAASREVREETGIDAAPGALEPLGAANTFEIYAQWRHRFAPGVTHN